MPDSFGEVKKVDAFCSLSEMADALKNNETTSIALTELFLNRITQFNGKLNAYAAVHYQAALEEAATADKLRQSGKHVGKLHGLPIAIKDLFEIAGSVASCGSRAWQARTSTCTSTVVKRLRAAGMIVIGNTHMAEFAMGAWGTNPLMGTPRNPWDLIGSHYVPGGSSSGSGVAVAAGLAPAAIGSDTGGSVRIPAALNGLTGVKTTQGLINLSGVPPLSASLDTVGPMTRTAVDAALLIEILAGPDPLDPKTLGRPTFAFDLTQGVSMQGVRIAVMVSEQYPWSVSDDVQAATEQVICEFQYLGAKIEYAKVPVDFAELAKNMGALIAAEAYQVHASYIADTEIPIGSVVREKILRGEQIDAAKYQAILNHRKGTIATFKQWMKAYDLLLTPTTPSVACPIEQVDENIAPLSTFTRAVNYLDTCAISLPAGFSATGLPIGVQLISRPWHENLLLRSGHAFQQRTKWHERTPSHLGNTL